MDECFPPQALRCGALRSGIRFWTCRWFGEKLGEVNYEQKRQARGGPVGHLPGRTGHSQVLPGDEVVGAVLPAGFCWTGIPSIVGFIEGIIYLFQSEEKFNQKYNPGLI